MFCETIDTVDLVYEKLSGYAEDSLMIGKLHGQTAEIKNHQTNKTTILQILKTNIREGNRSVLITTGKSGGTGINLGEFSTVVHYELPFSSNELEQRFGRIERADDLINVPTDNVNSISIKNKMIFLINKGKSNELDFITNRMLYYSINKINKTVQYMPIRNTVLFHPVYMKRVIEKGEEIWNKVRNELKPNEDVFTYYSETKKVEETMKKILTTNGESYSNEGIWKNIEFILNNTSNDKKDQDNIGIIKEYKKNYKKTSKDFDDKLENYKILIEYYLFLKKTLLLWGKWNTNQEDTVSDFEITNADSESEEINNSITNADSESEKINNSITTILNNLSDDENRMGTIKIKIDNMIKVLKPIGSDSASTYSGVFYMVKDKDNNNIMVNKHFD